MPRLMGPRSRGPEKQTYRMSKSFRAFCKMYVKDRARMEPKHGQGAHELTRVWGVSVEPWAGRLLFEMEIRVDSNVRQSFEVKTKKHITRTGDHDLG